MCLIYKICSRPGVAEIMLSLALSMHQPILLLAIVLYVPIWIKISDYLFWYLQTQTTTCTVLVQNKIDTKNNDHTEKPV